MELPRYLTANAYCTFATLFAFIVKGANEAAYGVSISTALFNHFANVSHAIIPYLKEYYSLTYVVVSLVSLSPLGGYVGAALLNNWLYVHFGQRGVALLCPICHLVVYTGISLHPPYPVLVVLFIFAGFENGILDAGWNAWVGDMANVNKIPGFLHGCYGLGAILSPLAAMSLITKNGWQWYSFYYLIMVSNGKTHWQFNHR